MQYKNEEKGPLFTLCLLLSLQLRKYIDFFEELVRLTDKDWQDSEVC